MRTFLCGAMLVVALGVARPAHAQFLNRSLGFSAGYMNFSGIGLAPVPLLSWGVPIGISGSWYLENGFEVVAHVHAMILVNPIDGEQYFGFTPNLGIRYLLSQESFRPYVGLDVAYLQFFASPSPDQTTQINTTYVGIGPNVGFEYFPADSYSLGARLQYNLYWWLNQRADGALGLTAELAFYF